MHQEHLDALIVCGNQYAGFEGAVLYMSGFEIVHRYVYVLLPLEGQPTLVFPREARWIGDKAKPWVKDHVWPDIPGQWIRERAQERKWKRIGVYGMNIVLSGSDGQAQAHFKVPGLRAVAPDDLLLYSLEITGAGGYWVEFSRALLRGKPSDTTRRMADAYPDALEKARKLMRAGELA